MPRSVEIKPLFSRFVCLRVRPTRGDEMSMFFFCTSATRDQACFVFCFLLSLVDRLFNQRQRHEQSRKWGGQSRDSPRTLKYSSSFSLIGEGKTDKQSQRVHIFWRLTLKIICKSVLIWNRSGNFELGFNQYCLHQALTLQSSLSPESLVGFVLVYLVIKLSALSSFV